jgi:O-antigen/teichoic acid export membrane protein
MLQANRLTEWIRAGIGNKTVGGLFSSGLWLAARYLIPLLTFPYLARVLGATGFGLLAVGTAVIAYAMVVTDWGFNISSMQQAARNRDSPEEVNRIIWATIGARAMLGAGSAALVIVGALVFAHDRELQLVLIVSTLNVLGSVIAVDWALRGVEQFAKFATASIVGRLCAVPLVFLLVHDRGDVPMAAFASASGGLISGGIALVMAARIGILRRPLLSVRASLAQIRDGRHLFLSNVAVSVYTTSLHLVLAAVSGVAQVGVFSGADKIRAPVQNLLSPISMVFYPRMAYLASAQPAGARVRAIQLLRIQGGLALALAICLFVAAPQIVALLLGDGFEASVPVLRILCLVVVLIGVSNVLGLMIMLPFDMKRQFTACIVAGAVVGLAVAVPGSYYFGAIGTAIASVAAEATVTIAMFVTLYRRLDWFRPGPVA